MSIMFRPSNVAIPKVRTNYAARRGTTKLMFVAPKLPTTLIIHKRGYSRMIKNPKLEFTSNESDDIFPVKAEQSLQTMQKTFRIFGLLTVQEGERYGIWNADGSYSEIAGPARKFVINANFMPLPRIVAEPSEFLRIVDIHGNKSYVEGPTSMWFEPLKHTNIKLLEGMRLNSKEAVVIYKGKPDSITREVLYGPTLVIPKENQWIHGFSWHGADPTRPNVSAKIPAGLVFHRLRCMPDQLYYDVENVRTKDDALITVKLMIFFQLENIENMVDHTHDPIAIFINSASADVITFVSKRSFEQFKRDSDALNLLSTFSELTTRLEGVGYKIHQVVFRGYESSKTLQHMHDSAIEKRTSLQLETETEVKAQELIDYKLKCKRERIEKEQQMEMDQLAHKQSAHQQEHDFNLKINQEVFNAQQKQNRTVERAAIDHLQQLRNIGVDLSKYLIAKEQKPDKLVQINTTPENPIHYHHESKDAPNYNYK